MGIAERSVALAMALENRAQGKRIAELRERKGLSQEELARRVDVSKGAVQNWEAGRGIRGENLRRVAEVLETTPEEIRGDAEMPNPFSLQRHLDARTEEFRAFCLLMVAEFNKVSDKLDRQYGMLERIFEKLATPEAAAELLEGAELLERLAEGRAAARDEPSAAQAGRRRRRAS